MHLKFLNHSSLLITSETKILCDPWFKGTAFSDGWSLLYDNSHNINDIDFDYIWLSHEHPDHFSIPTLRELNKSCTFLFQETKDKKVKDYLEGKGHSVIELKNKEETIIGDLKITSFVCDGFDSSLLVKYPDDKVLLNINDAMVLDDIEVDKVDLLTFQYSYANWAGNEGDKKIPKHLQSIIDDKNDKAIAKFRPKAIMPFASFVYFSHEENFYWNDNNWIDHVFSKYYYNESTLIFPKPDQSISLYKLHKGNYLHHNLTAKTFWKDKHNSLTIKNKVKPLTLDQIKERYLSYNKKLNEENTIQSDLSINIKITDLNKTIKVGLVETLFEEVDEKETISVSSETAGFLFTQLFARGTVCVNSRVSFNYETAHLFFLFFFIPYANNIGIYFDEFPKDTLKLIMKTTVMSAISNINLINPKYK